MKKILPLGLAVIAASCGVFASAWLSNTNFVEANATAGTDTLTASDFGITGSAYTEFSYSSIDTEATYSGILSYNSKGYLQMKNSNAGFFVSVSAGIVESVTVTLTDQNSANLTLYGNNMPYTDVFDLYSSNASVLGTSLGSLNTTTTITPTDDYAFIGLVNTGSGSAQIQSIAVTWKDGTIDEVISFSHSGTPTTQYIGTPVDMTGVTFTATFKNKGECIIPLEQVSFSPAVISSETTQIVASYQGFDRAIPVEPVVAEATSPVEFDLTTETYSSSSAETVVWEYGPVTMKAEKGTSSSEANSYLGGKNAHTRFYDGFNVSISVQGSYSISSIVFTATGQNYLKFNTNDLVGFTAVQDGSVLTLTATGNANSVNIPVNGTARLNKVSIAFSAITTPIITVNPVSDLDVGATGTLTAETINVEAGTSLVWTSSDPAVLKVESDGSYEALSHGVATVTASVVVSGVTYSGSIRVVVNGGLITVAEALEIGAGLAAGESTAYTVQLSGIVSKVSSTSNRYLYDATGEILVYGYRQNSGDWSRGIALAVTGTIENYRGTLEITNVTFDEVGSVSNTETFATAANDHLDDACANLNVTPAIWQSVSQAYAEAGLTDVEKAFLKSKSAAGTDEIGSFISRYDYITSKYGYSDFIGRNADSASINNGQGFDNTIIMIASISAAMLLVGIAGTIIITKRKRA